MGAKWLASKFTLKVLIGAAWLLAKLPYKILGRGVPNSQQFLAKLTGFKNQPDAGPSQNKEIKRQHV